MSTVKENLIAARALIDTPEKCAFGEKAHGLSIIGAINSVIPEDDIVAYRDIVKSLISVMPATGKRRLAIWNWVRSRTHADIMALFDRAIAAQDGAS